MSFIETPIFPLTVSFGARLGPSFKTSIVVTDSGREYRNKDWSYPLHRGTVSLNARDARMAVIREWLYVAGGRAEGFRVKDVTDFSVPDNSGIGALVLVESTSSGDVYQMVKRYTRGLSAGDRKISKPTVGATSLYDVTTSGETLKLLNTHYEIDESTGLMTILFDPDGELEWRGTFEIPMRFDLDDFQIEAIDRSGDEYLQGIDEIQLVELLIES